MGAATGTHGCSEHSRRITAVALVAFCRGATTNDPATFARDGSVPGGTPDKVLCGEFHVAGEVPAWDRPRF